LAASDPEFHNNFVELLKKEVLVIPDNDSKVAFPFVNDSTGGKLKAPRSAKATLDKKLKVPRFAKSTLDKAMKYLLSVDAKQPPRTGGCVAGTTWTLETSSAWSSPRKLFKTFSKHLTQNTDRKVFERFQTRSIPPVYS
jgi:hypothetical protein